MYCLVLYHYICRDLKDFFETQQDSSTREKFLEKAKEVASSKAQHLIDLHAKSKGSTAQQLGYPKAQLVDLGGKIAKNREKFEVVAEKYFEGIFRQSSEVEIAVASMH